MRESYPSFLSSRKCISEREPIYSKEAFIEAESSKASVRSGLSLTEVKIWRKSNHPLLLGRKSTPDREPKLRAAIIYPWVIYTRLLCLTQGIDYSVWVLNGFYLLIKTQLYSTLRSLVSIVDLMLSSTYYIAYCVFAIVTHHILRYFC